MSVTLEIAVNGRFQSLEQGIRDAVQKGVRGAGSGNPTGVWGGVASGGSAYDGGRSAGGGAMVEGISAGGRGGSRRVRDAMAADDAILRSQQRTDVEMMKRVNANLSAEEKAASRKRTAYENAAQDQIEAQRIADVEMMKRLEKRTAAEKTAAEKSVAQKEKEESGKLAAQERAAARSAQLAERNKQMARMKFEGGLMQAQRFGLLFGVGGGLNQLTGGNFPLFGPLSSMMGMGLSMLPLSMATMPLSMGALGALEVGGQIAEGNRQSMAQVNQAIFGGRGRSGLSTVTAIGAASDVNRGFMENFADFFTSRGTGAASARGIEAARLAMETGAGPGFQWNLLEASRKYKTPAEEIVKSISEVVSQLPMNRRAGVADAMLADYTLAQEQNAIIQKNRAERDSYNTPASFRPHYDQRIAAAQGVLRQIAGREEARDTEIQNAKIELLRSELDVKSQIGQADLEAMRRNEEINSKYSERIAALGVLAGLATSPEEKAMLAMQQGRMERSMASDVLGARTKDIDAQLNIAQDELSRAKRNAKSTAEQEAAQVAFEQKVDALELERQRSYNERDEARRVSRERERMRVIGLSTPGSIDIGAAMRGSLDLPGDLTLGGGKQLDALNQTMSRLQDRLAPPAPAPSMSNFQGFEAGW